MPNLSLRIKFATTRLVSVVTFLMSFSPAKATSELSVVALIGECTDYLEKGSQQLTHAVQQRVTSIISAMRSKSIRADSPQQIGNLIAILSKLVPIQNPLFSELCDAVAALCIDREFVQFEDGALETVFEIVLKHLELRSFDPSPGLRALSTLLYNNTLRLPKFHERILEVALSVASVSAGAAFCLVIWLRFRSISWITKYTLRRGSSCCSS